MKKVIIGSTLAVALITGMSSCKDEAIINKTDEQITESSELDYSDFKGESLKKYGINAIIMLPDETSNTGASVVPDFERIEDRMWNIEMGPRFEMVIEDLGGEENAIARVKQQNEDVGIYKIEYIIDEPNLIMFKRSIKYTDDSNLEVKKTTTYHCAGTTKIDGINYLIKSGKDDVGFPKPIIEEMVKTIQSIEPLETK